MAGVNEALRSSKEDKMPSHNSLWHSIARSIRAVFRTLFRHNKVETELDSELRFHLESQIESNIRTGMSPEAARNAALREFGGIELAKEECRDERRTQFLEQFWQDVRYGTRMLRKNPGFTAVAVLTLALGIGANSAIFNLIEAVLMRPLPVPHPAELLLVEWTTQQKPVQDQFSIRLCQEYSELYGVAGCGFSYRTFHEIRSHASSVASFAAISSGNKLHVSLGSGTEHIPALADFTSGDFFAVLQVTPILGRGFVLDDDRLGANPVAIISYNLWKDRFGSDPKAVGRSIFLEDTEFTVVGVTSPDFPGVNQVHPSDLWIPIHTIAQFKRDSIWTTPDTPNRLLAIIARVRPEVPRESAEAELTTLYRGALSNDPLDSMKPATPREIILDDFSRGAHTAFGKQFANPLVILMVIVSCVLLIACANVASLTLARASGRRSEIAVRFALGAGRGRRFASYLRKAFSSPPRVQPRDHCWQFGSLVFWPRSSVTACQFKRCSTLGPHRSFSLTPPALQRFPRCSSACCLR